MKLLMTCLLGIASVAAFAQKGELKDAQSAYDNYATLRGQKVAAIQLQAKKSVADAKIAIDKASTNDKTGTLPQTYALKAAIYSSLAVDDTVATTSAPLFAAADDAVKKAKELDTKNEFKKLIDDANINLAQYKLTAGVKDYQNKRYDEAYKEFDYYRTVLPDDTNAIYYTALSAGNAADKDPKYYQYALENYKKLVTTKYTGAPKAYYDMTTIYLTQKDTTNALKIASEGIEKFPKYSELRKREIEIALVSGKQADVVTKIQTAITNDPKNKDLYYYLGLTYSQVADAANGRATKAKDDATKSKEKALANDNLAKAGDAYKKALEMDPDLDVFNAAQRLPANKQKEYDAELAKSDKMLEPAKPYLQKALDLKPTDLNALSNLRNYYRAKSDPAHAAENKAKANELKQKIDAINSGGGK